MDISDAVDEINAVTEGTLHDENVAIKSLQDVADFELDEEGWDGDDPEQGEWLTDGRTGEQLDPEKVREAHEEEMQEHERRPHTTADVKVC